MAMYDRSHDGFRVFVGELGSRAGKYELEREFEFYGPITDVWVARNPPGFAFIVFKHQEHANKAVRELDGRVVCGRRVRVEPARPYEARRRGPPPQRWGGGAPAHRYGRRSRSRSRDRKRSHSRSRDKRRYSRSRSRSLAKKFRNRNSRNRSRSSRRTRDRSRSRSSTSSRSSSRERTRSKEKLRRYRTDSDRSQKTDRKRSYSKSPVKSPHNGKLGQSAASSHGHADTEGRAPVSVK